MWSGTPGTSGRLARAVWGQEAKQILRPYWQNTKAMWWRTKGEIWRLIKPYMILSATPQQLVAKLWHDSPRQSRHIISTTGRNRAVTLRLLTSPCVTTSVGFGNILYYYFFLPDIRYENDVRLRRKRGSFRVNIRAFWRFSVEPCYFLQDCCQLFLINWPPASVGSLLFFPPCWQFLLTVDWS